MTDATTAAPVLLARQGATAVLTLNRPAQRNAIDDGMREGLEAAIAELRADETVRAVILTGAGQNFCAGGDLAALGIRRTAWQGRERIRRLHRWFRELSNLEKPVIAAVDGSAFGAGLSLALAADFVVATDRARFCAVFARVGLVPDLGAMWLLPRIVGLQRAKELFFSARILSAAQAQDLGLVFRIVPQADLIDAALALAARFHTAPTEVIGITKTVLNQSFNLDQAALAELEAAAQAIALAGDYHSDAVERFRERKPPAFDWNSAPDGPATKG